MTVRIRALGLDDESDIALVAERMRATLVEVLGPERGGDMYSPDWLRERVRWHLRPADCTGAVLVAEHAHGSVVGHTILRLEADDSGSTIGLYATIWVAPDARRAGLANRLLDTGESWFAQHPVQELATATSQTNQPLIQLFERRGYAITLRVPDSGMVRLTRPCP